MAKSKISKEFFLEHYYKGLSDRQIADIINMDHSTVSRFRRKLNLPRMTLINLFKDDVTELVGKGYSDNKISHILKISKSHIQYIRKSLKLKTNFIEHTYSTHEDRVKGYMLRNARSSAKRRGFEFNLIYEDIYLPKYCPYIGTELKYTKRTINRESIEFNMETIPTIDRIDNSKGYIKGNVIVVSRLANAMKNSASIETLEIFCKNISKLINIYKNQGARGDITSLLGEEFSFDP